MSMYVDHTKAITSIGTELLSNEGKRFIVDDNNREVLRFLLLYFNKHPDALKVFPDQNYSLHKNILLIGEPGTGKTLMMQAFSEYLKRTANPFSFRNIGVTELVNYQKMFGHINLFTYNQKGHDTFEGKPFHLCMNDLGLDVEKQKSYGTDMKLIIEEFMFSRYELWLNKGIRYHLTSNMTTSEFKMMFEGRLVDRMKSFNVITLKGGSRR